MNLNVVKAAYGWIWGKVKNASYRTAMFVRLIETCPNCESAWTGGHPDPEERGWCLLCGPGPRFWIWGPNFLSHIESRRNIAHLNGILKCEQYRRKQSSL